MVAAAIRHRKIKTGILTVGGSVRLIAGSAVANVMNVGLWKWVWAKGVSLHGRSVVVVTVVLCEVRAAAGETNSQISGGKKNNSTQVIRGFTRPCNKR